MENENFKVVKIEQNPFAENKVEICEVRPEIEKIHRKIANVKVGCR